jgi:predicted transcriptional regulator
VDRFLEESVALTPRDKVYSEIVKSPGLHFREIQRRTGLATGALQYHLDYLRKKNFVFEKKEGKFSRFYSTQENNIDSTLMNLLRQDQVRKIALILLAKRRATLVTLKKETNMSVSTLNFHLDKLILANIVEKKIISSKEYYLIKNKEPLIEVLYTYRESFLDALVDNFLDLWEKDLK